jgi:hypothetical protein
MGKSQVASIAKKGKEAIRNARGVKKKIWSTSCWINSND